MLDPHFVRKLDSSLACDSRLLSQLEEACPSDHDKFYFLMFLFNSDNLNALRNAVSLDSFRRIFIQSSDSFQLIAISGCGRDKYISILPDNITPEEADILFEKLVIRKDSLANVLVRSGIIPTISYFNEVCTSYSFKPNRFMRDLINDFFVAPGFSWKKYMLFPDTVGKADVIERIKNTDAKAYFLLASWLLSDKDKMSLVKSVTGKHFLFNIADNMDMPEGWESSIPKEYRSVMLRRDAGI